MKLLRALEETAAGPALDEMTEENAETLAAEQQSGKVQQELLRHADIRTTMNIYTDAVAEDLREAHERVVQAVLQ